MRRSKIMPPHRKAGYIFNIIFNLIFLWVLQNVPGWDLDFLTSGYMVILTIMQVTCLINVAGNLVSLIVDTIYMRYLVKIILDSLVIVILVLLYYLYPFNFSHTPHFRWLNDGLPFFIILAFIGTGISIISSFFNIFVKEDELY